MTDTTGSHHVTSTANDPQRNVDVYTAVPGGRRVKLTADFDDRYTDHHDDGDEVDLPGRS
jgi:glyoxalase family protein